MTLPRTPHDFLLYLRTRCPALARRLDGLGGLERAGSGLALRVPEGSWAHQELDAQKQLLETEAQRFFGPRMGTELFPTPADPEALPLPVLSSKYWNHVAFCGWSPRRAAVLAVRKPRYLDHWLPRALRVPDGDLLRETLADPDCAWFGYSTPHSLPPGEDAVTWLLPQLLEDLAALARAGGSYAHLVSAFPGDPTAERWESRLYAAKEWGTPSVPSSILRKYAGRLHYAGPGETLLGLRLVRLALEEG